MKLFQKFTVCLIIFALFGCSKKEEGFAPATAPAGRMAAMSKADAVSEMAQPVEDKAVIGKKVIKEGNLTFQCDDIGKTRSRVDSLVAKFGGYVTSESEHTYSDKVEQTLVIRVPAEGFDAFISEVSEGVKKFDWKNIQATDVTEEYVDVETRLNVKKETELRFREILKKARSVEEIVSVEKNLGEIRAEIESMEGRLKYLDNRVSFSNLTLTIYESVSAPVGFWMKIKAGMGSGWNNFLWFIIWLVNIWPFVILAFIILIFFMGMRRGRRGRSL